MTVRGAVYTHLYINCLELMSLHPPLFFHPLLVNAGTVAALLALPREDRLVAAFQVLSLLFAANLLVFGRIMEYRIWLELIPLSVFALGATLLGDRGCPARPNA